MNLYPYKTDSALAAQLDRLNKRVRAAEHAAREEDRTLQHLKAKAESAREQLVQRVAKEADETARGLGPGDRGESAENRAEGRKSESAENRAEGRKKLERARDKYMRQSEDTVKRQGLGLALERAKAERESFLDEHAEEIAAELVDEGVELHRRLHEALNACSTSRTNGTRWTAGGRASGASCPVWRRASSARARSARWSKPYGLPPSYPCRRPSPSAPRRSRRRRTWKP